MRYLIIGHGGHGKTTLANILNNKYGVKFKDSSMAAAEIFLFDILKEEKGYETFEECYNDRHSPGMRAKWYKEITDYNYENKARLASDILIDNDMYVGMRSYEEISECKKQGLFDIVIGVYNPYKPEEGTDSFNIDLWKESDLIIPTIGTELELEERVDKISNIFV